MMEEENSTWVPERQLSNVSSSASITPPMNPSVIPSVNPPGSSLPFDVGSTTDIVSHDLVTSPHANPFLSPSVTFVSLEDSDIKSIEESPFLEVSSTPSTESTQVTSSPRAKPPSMDSEFSTVDVVSDRSPSRSPLTSRTNSTASSPSLAATVASHRRTGSGRVITPLLGPPSIVNDDGPSSSFQVTSVGAESSILSTPLRRILEMLPSKSSPGPHWDESIEKRSSQTALKNFNQPLLGPPLRLEESDSDVLSRATSFTSQFSCSYAMVDETIGMVNVSVASARGDASLSTPVMEAKFDPFSGIRSSAADMRSDEDVTSVKDQGQFIKIETLRGVSAVPPPQYGVTTCVCVAECGVITGTVSGAIILHASTTLASTSSTEVWDLNDTNRSGAVMCLDVAPVNTSTWIVAGYQLGAVAIFDILKKKVPLIVILNPNVAPVIHVLAFSGHPRIISVDKTGCVLCHEISTSKMFKNTSKSIILYGGDNPDPVYAISLSPLPPRRLRGTISSLSDRLLYNETLPLVAISGSKSTIIMSLHHSNHICHRQKLNADRREASVVYHAWILLDSTHPLLAIASGLSVELLQVVPHADLTQPPEFVPRIHLSIDLEISNIQWLSERVMVLLDITNRIRVIDPTAGKEVECIDVTAIGLRDDQPLFDSFGPLESSFHHTICVHGSVSYILGESSVFFIQPLSWHERLSKLEEATKFQDALELIMALWDGRSLAVMGLPRNVAESRGLLRERLIELLSTCSLHALQRYAFRNDIKALASVDMTVRMCITACCHTDLYKVISDVLYPLYTCFGFSELFLIAVDEVMLSVRPNSWVSATVLGALFEVLRRRGLVSRMDTIIHSMNLLSADHNLHMLRTLCRQHYLLKGLVRVMAIATDDYLSPFIELVALLRELDEVSSGNRSRSSSTTDSIEPSKVEETKTDTIVVDDLGTRTKAVQKEACLRACLGYLTTVLGGDFYNDEKIPSERLFELLPRLYAFIFDGVLSPKSSSDADQTTPSTDLSGRDDLAIATRRLKVAPVIDLLMFDDQSILLLLLKGQHRTALKPFCEKLGTILSSLSIKSIDLSRCGISDEAVLSLAAILACNVSISTVSLSGNQISNDGVLYIRSILDQNKSILNVDLSDNPLAERKFIDIVDDCLQRRRAAIA